MEQFDIDLETIREEINKGNAKIIASQYCAAFDKYVSNNFPWVPITGYRIDWSHVKGNFTRLNWDEADEEKTVQFFKKSCLNSFNEVCIIYGADEPGILVKFDDYLFKNLWRFLPPGFGTRFIVGAKQNSYGNIELVNECFIEIDNDCSAWLTASS